ncbi:MAG: YraN family protein [Flavisolibacter sp.]|jgi:putative endonuclease|nr:YraN family protein [Flavisolibacter sp.]
MATHIDAGKAGEKLAATWLAQNGFTILQHNWRFSHYEIDLIATKNNLLHFIEVKYRSSNWGGYPEEAVNQKKIKDLLKAIDQYLFLNPQHDNFHLDILAITAPPGKPTEYFFIEDVTVE